MTYDYGTAEVVMALVRAGADPRARTPGDVGISRTAEAVSTNRGLGVGGLFRAHVASKAFEAPRGVQVGPPRVVVVDIWAVKNSRTRRGGLWGRGEQRRGRKRGGRREDEFGAPGS